MKSNWIDLRLNKLKKFKKEERSSFSYWYNHWLAFNLLAIKLGVWRIKYLFHDFEKPWLKLFIGYEKLQKIHRSWSDHHVEYKGTYDLIAMILDWECSRYTKLDAPLNAWDTMNKYHLDMKDLLEPAFKKLNLYEYSK